MTSPEMPRTHDGIAELLGAYALDAVAPEEAELITRHLETCPRCRAELEGHREVAGMLGAMGGPAPLGLWDQIVANAHEAPPALRLERAGPAPSVAPPTPIRSRRSLSVRFVAAAAAVAAAIVAVLGVEVARLDDRTQSLTSQVASIGPAPSMESVRQALATPGAKQVDLTSLSGSHASVQAVVLPGGQGYIYDDQLAPLADGRTYQLWGGVGTQRISYGLLGTDPTTVLPFRAGDGLQYLAVTDEVSGGVEESSQPAVVVGGVTAVPAKSTPS